MRPEIVAGVLAALVGPFMGFLVAVRRLSGRIATSDASQLWAESASIREDYRTRIAASERRQAALEERIARLEGDNRGLREENAGLRVRLDECVEDLERRRSRQEGG